jgi:hypothetical protein
MNPKPNRTRAPRDAAVLRPEPGLQDDGARGAGGARPRPLRHP